MYPKEKDHHIRNPDQAAAFLGDFAPFAGDFAAVGSFEALSDFFGSSTGLIFGRTPP